MSTFINHYGRRFAVLAAFPASNVEAANAFMTANPCAAVLTEHKGMVYLADKKDMGEPTPRPAPAIGNEVLCYHVTESGQAFILEADGTTVCEILAPGHNSRGPIARDLVHAQLSAAKLLAALKGVMAGLVEQDDEGLIEHAEQMVFAREAVAFAEGA